MLTDLWNYLTTSANWHDADGTPGLLTNIRDHLIFSLIPVVVAALIAIPVGLWIGHTGKGAALVVGTVNASRALPTFGLIVLLYVLIAPHFTGHSDAPSYLPVEIVLLLLAIPPILSNTFAGVQSVDPATRDAARGMGMRDRQVLLQVELPGAYPLMMSGLRSAVLQVLATATVGAYISLDCLGAPIYYGLQQGPFQDTEASHLATGQVLAGALLVAVLALAADLILALVQRYTTSRGITGRYRRIRGATEVAVAAADVREPLVGAAAP